jgi:hypothetical protein
MSNAYLVLITWSDGTEGLLFPRPGNVPICTTEEQGLKDFETAVEHLKQIASTSSNPRFRDAKVRLVRFTRQEVVQSFPDPVEKLPPTVVADLSEAERNVLLQRLDPYEREVVAALGCICPKCGRQMSRTLTWGYVCEYCAGIED